MKGQSSFIHVSVEKAFYIVYLSLRRSKYYEAGSVHRRVILTHDIGDLQTMGVTLEYPRSIMSWVRLEKPTFFLESITVEPLGENTKYVDFSLLWNTLPPK